MTNIKASIIGSLSILFTLAIIFTPGFAGQQQKVTLRVDGLACPFCAYGMEKKLKRIENLEKLDIKINQGLVLLYFKEGAKIDKQLITKKVKEAGFTPGELQIDNKPEGQQISLNIKGMSCEGCVARVKNALNALDCVQDVEVNLTAENAAFTCTDVKSNPDKFVEAIRKLGFDANLASQSKN